MIRWGFEPCPDGSQAQIAATFSGGEWDGRVLEGNALTGAAFQVVGKYG